MTTKFQHWNQDARTYDGKHDMEEVVMTTTIEDVLWAMYAVNVDLTDDNLNRVLKALDNGFWGSVNEDMEN